MNKYPCPCELCDHNHRWLIGWLKCRLEHFGEALMFGPSVNEEGIRLKRLLKRLEEQTTGKMPK